MMVVDDRISAWLVLFGTFALDQDPASCLRTAHVIFEIVGTRRTSGWQQCAILHYIEAKASSSSCRAWRFLSQLLGQCVCRTPSGSQFWTHESTFAVLLPARYRRNRKTQIAPSNSAVEKPRSS